MRGGWEDVRGMGGGGMGDEEKQLLVNEYFYLFSFSGKA